MRHTIYLLVLGLLIGFISCEKKIDWPASDAKVNTLVVEALLTNEFKYQHVRLSLPRNDINDTSAMATGAVVTVNDGANSMNFIESVDMPGYYISEQNILLAHHFLKRFLRSYLARSNAAG